ncbi:hypothetical protein MSAN_02385700 [Mycena sanguinolenta]|uniref:Uncharacterized protein n=1 Tax=Mycena sanguinolenta TaxID=230812 RepID=A0A8H6X4T3_9AGAR|nr:hypothetical protein MSAN_02385700 [Mycena sanguinolenta]
MVHPHLAPWPLVHLSPIPPFLLPPNPPPHPVLRARTQPTGSSGVGDTRSPVTLDGEDEEDDSASIDAPLDAHILPGTGRHTCALLPFIYVADADNARDLAASIAYQRYVWGISQPAVGFVLHNSVLELVISWVDPATHSVHIASPLTNSSKEDPTVGVFDLSNPTAALSLAKFVLGLSDDVTTILTCATTGCENNSFDWRSDNLPSHDFGSCQERVNRWVHDVAMPTEGSTGQQSLGVPSQTDTKTSQNAQSCSAFAVLPAADFNQRGGNIVSWTFYRHVYDCALIKVPLHAENASEINEKIDSYNTMCGFLPPSWTRNNPPYVHPHFTARVNMLLEQVVELQKSSASPAAFLKPKHEAIIGERLELLLSASMGAFTLLKREGQQKIPNVKEAESRHDWDAIFSRFYVDEEETISPHVLLERRIHFARNETAEMLKNTNTRSDVAAAHVKQALDYYDHCYAAQSGARDGEVIRNQAVTATNHANKLLTTITNLAKSANEFKKLVDRHSRQEPRDGICDAILFLPVRARADIISKGSFIRYTPTRATRAHAGEDTDEDTEEDAVEVTQQGTQQDNREDPQAAMELERKEILDNPFHTRREIVQNSVSGDFPVSGNHFLLPHAPVEYKKPSDNMGKPLNQGRMYLISIVAFYSALGIEDHAFYSVVTTGTFGAVIMAWKSSKNKIIYLIDRNVMTFNIAVPVEAFHFATFFVAPS